MKKNAWVRRGLWMVLTLVVAIAGLSGLVRTSAARRFLTARLEVAFGRPVEVSDFALTFLGMPRIEANGITVGEDARFGYEYFLRAERLSISIRWRALILGRLEFGTLSFTRPSLNLVRLADGRWNLESWLPPLIAAPPVPRPPGLPAPAPRFRRIEVDGGRINLMRGTEKHPFALVGVSGSVEQQSAGSWSLDLEAQPVRAGVTLQEPGTLRLRGRIGGTSARLQPADLLFTWQEVSLADVLRLSRGSDSGVRGRLAMQLTVRSLELPEDRLRVGAARWALEGSARIEKVHRWDLPERPANPALNLSVLAALRPGDSVLEVFESAIESPRSRVQLVGKVSWTRGIEPDFRLTSNAISMPDLLEWYRAFQPNVADDLAVDGTARLDLQASGWPVHVRQGRLMSTSSTLRTALLPAQVGIGRLAVRANGGMLELEPVSIDLPIPPAAPGPASPSSKTATSKKQSLRKNTPLPGFMRWRSSQSDTLRVEGSLQLPREYSSGNGSQSEAWRFKLQLAGQTSRVQDVLALAAALGRPLESGWSAEGKAELKVGWQGNLRPWSAVASGTMDLQGVQLRSVVTNQPVSIRAARIELGPGGSKLVLKDVRAFGAEWKGNIFARSSASDAGPEWEFDLSAGRLDVADLSRWLEARPSPSFLQRISPFGQSDRSSSERDAAIKKLRAHGRLSIEDFTLAPVSVRRLKAQVEVAGRKLIVRQANGEFYDGSLDASFEAQLTSRPTYQFEGRFSRVNLAQLAGGTDSLKGRLAGEASGVLKLVTHGMGREELLSSLEGDGKFTVRNARLRGLDLANRSPRNVPLAASPQFQAESEIAVQERQVRFDRLLLRAGGNQFEASGSVDFARAMDLNLLRVSSEQRKVSASPPQENFRLTGTLEAPMLSAPPSAQSARKVGRKAAAGKP